MAEMNALDLIKDDHNRLRDLFKRAMSTDDGSARAVLLDEIRAELVAHERMEEDVFYPALRAASDDAKDLVLEGYEEHHVIDTILDEMFVVPEEADQWGAKLKVLHENLEHHLEEEEGKMFKRARQSLSREALDELGRQMRQVKAAVSA